MSEAPARIVRRPQDRRALPSPLSPVSGTTASRGSASVIERAFRGAKRACYAGLDSVTLRRRVAERLTGVVPFDAYGFGTTDPDTGLLNHMVAADMPEPLASDYIDRLYPYDCACHAIDAARGGHRVYETGDESRDVLDRMRELGFSHGTHVVLGTRATLWGKWCLLSERIAPTSVRRAHALLRRLAPHLTRGLQQAALMRAATTPSDDQPVSGVLVLDPTHRPVLRSASVLPILDDLADVGLAYPDHVPLAIVNAVSQLRARLAAVHADMPETVTIRAHGHSGRWYSVQCSLTEPDARGATAAVVIVRPIIAREVASMLSRIYGLSPREREVVAAVARGFTTKEIAVRLGVSAHTVKEHLDRASEKTGARGRKALVARLFFDAYAPQLFTT